MNKVSELRRMFSATAWAMRYEDLNAMRAAALDLLSAGGSVAEHAMEALKAAREIEAVRRQQISASTGGAVAVLPLYGVISQRSNWMSYYFGGTTTEGFTMQFREAMANPNVTAIVIDVDSPGGSVAGVDELASEIHAARSKKTIVALSNTLNASAAYYLSCQASELVVMPSSLTGSIGVYQTHESDAGYLDKLGIAITLIAAGKYKVEGNSYEPLTAEAKAAMQSMVDGYYSLFVKAVARGRGVKAAEVTAGFGEGRVLMAADAVATGMADRIGTLDSVLAKFGVKRPVDGANAAVVVTTAPVAQTEAAEQPVAATDAPVAEEDDGRDDEGDQDIPCDCPCASCKAGDCSGCTTNDCDEDGCQCSKAKAKAEVDANVAAAAEQTRLLALQRQRIAFALNAQAAE